MKKIILLLLLVALTTKSYAEDKVTLFDHGDYLIEVALKEEPGWQELLSYFVTCRLDEICILQSLRQSIAFTNPPQLIKDVFKKYDAKRYDIYKSYQYCRLRDIVKVKEKLALCYGKLNDPSTANLSNTEKLQSTALCMESSLMEMAEKENLFALQALVDLYEETGKTENARIWQKVLDTRQDDPNNEYVQQCIQTMHIMK